VIGRERSQALRPGPMRVKDLQDASAADAGRWGAGWLRPAAVIAGPRSRRHRRVSNQARRRMLVTRLASPSEADRANHQSEPVLLDGEDVLDGDPDRRSDSIAAGDMRRHRPAARVWPLAVTMAPPATAARPTRPTARWRTCLSLDSPVPRSRPTCSARCRRPRTQGWRRRSPGERFRC
jgi:hypothetical protein